MESLLLWSVAAVFAVVNGSLISLWSAAAASGESLLLWAAGWL